MHIGQVNALPPEEIAARRAEAALRDRAHFVFPHRLADGSIRMVDVHSSPIEVSGRTLLFSVIHDVTEREEQSEQLRRAAAVFDTSAEAIVMTDANGLVDRVNPAFTKLTGWTAEEIRGQHSSTITPVDGIPADGPGTAVNYRGEALVNHADGTRSPCMLSISSVHDPDGALIGHVGLMTDLTSTPR